MNTSRKITFIALLMIAFYAVVSFFIVSDYGINPDEPTAFGLGDKYLHYYKTGHLDFKDELPEIKNHPNFYNKNVKTLYHHDWPFTNTLSAITCSIFFQKLNLLDPISAHHIIVPLLTLLLLLFMFLFVKRYWNATLGLISMLILITTPRFFGHTFYNTKDIPEVVFFSITIFLFAQWFFSEKIKYLYGSFIFWGFAIGTKMDAFLAPIILGLWQTPFLFRSLINNTSIKLRTIFHFMIGFFITAISVIAYFPTLQPWFYKNTKDYLVNAPMYLHKMFRYVIGIGGDINSSWNLYAPSQIAYTIPIIMLLFFSVGFIYLIINLRKQKLNSLLLIWVLLPVLRHCFPHVNHYDALRHFLIFIVPFAIITAIGIDFVANLISTLILRQAPSDTKADQRTFIIKKIIIIILSGLILIPNLYNIVALHPFQTTYYNFLVGGLKGAQKKGIPFSSDYWMNSARKAVEWINKNAPQNAKITILQHRVLEHYNLRNDIQIVRYDGNAPQKYSKLPNNIYLVSIPRIWDRLDRPTYTLDKILPDHKKFDIVYQIKRQGGEIMTIYYKP